MDQELSKQEKNNQRKGAITSLTAHVAILFLFLLPFTTFPDPPPGPAGVLVSFGEPEQGVNTEERAAPSEPEAVEEPVEEVEEVEEPEVVPEPEASEPEESPKINTDENSRERAIAQAKKEAEERARRIEREKQRKADEEARKKREAEAAKRRAEEEARKKREAEAQALKDAIGGAFNGGRGNGGKPGDQGQPDGDPDGSALDGISTGAGEIGGDLGGRGVLSKPRITDNSQKTGDVVMKVCVDATGKVFSAKYTQSGSTTSDARLVETARKAALRYKFERGSVDKQCGTIKIKFRLR